MSQKPMPTKGQVFAALQQITDRFEAECEFPEPGDETAVSRDDLMGDLTAWLLKEAFDWGYYTGYEAGAGKPPVKMPTKVERPPTQEPTAQPGLFEDGDDQ